MGKSGVAFNSEVEFQKLFDFNSRKTRLLQLKTYLFADAGLLEYQNQDLNKISDLLIDFGVGAALTFHNKKYTFKPLTIRFDVPIYVSDTPNTAAFNYLIGINRAF